MANKKDVKRRSKTIHVKLGLQKRPTRGKAKIAPSSNGNNESTFHIPIQIPHECSILTPSNRINALTSGTETTPENKKLSINQSETKSRITNSTTLISKQMKRNPSKTTSKNVVKLLSIFLLCLLLTAALIIPNIILYVMLPAIYALVIEVQNPVNQSMNSSQAIYGNYCAGASSYTSWMNYSVLAIYMTINTGSCSFNITPIYYTSITGMNLQNQLTSNNAIYGPWKNGFQIYCRSVSGWSPEQLLNTSRIQKWNVSWVGIYY